MNGFLSIDPAVFVLFTVVIMGGAGYMTGQAIASTWRPAWQAVAYSLPLGAADRFLVFALFDGDLLSLSGYVLDAAVITAICLIGFRLRQVSKIVGQYPWLYERAGYFGVRSRNRRGDTGP